MLVGLIVGGVAASGWRVDRTFALLIAGVVSFWLADSAYLVLTAKGTWTSGGAFDIGWWITPLLFAAAAWQPPVAVRSAARPNATMVILVPIACGTLGLGVLVSADFYDLNALAIVLAALSLLAVMARLILTYRENIRMLGVSRHEALTDALTGLGNRRRLTADLDAALGDGAPPVTLALFDLDGFKGYNDTFGHPAGDTLLARLGDALARCAGRDGRAYRMGGDEFCVLLSPPDELLLADCAQALSARGEGFEVSCSTGAVRLPAEASTSPVALRIADQRLYANKRSGRPSARQETREVMLRILAARDPASTLHASTVADLAECVAQTLGLEPEAAEQVRHAAELHDVGKIAIPDEILRKRGALTPEEWEFIRRHTLIGERIINGAPALAPVAALVRASHERWDGTGYPDGLRAEQIPLGARIVAVCDAFDAMTKDRPYRDGMDRAARDRRAAGLRRDAVRPGGRRGLRRRARRAPRGRRASRHHHRRPLIRAEPAPCLRRRR